MKKFLLSCMLLVGAMSTFAQYAITVSPVKVAKGASAIMFFEMTSELENSVMGAQFDVAVPKGFTLSNFQFDDRIDAELWTKNFDDHTTYYTVQIYTGATEAAATGNSGVFGHVTITEDGTNEAGVISGGLINEAKISAMPGPEGHAVADYAFDIEVTERLILDENTTVAPVAATGVNVTVNRTIKANEWSTFVLPIKLAKTKATEIFGSDAQFAEFESFEAEYTDDEDFTPNAITVNFKNYSIPRAGITAGKLLIIKTTKDITSFDVDGVDVTPESLTAVKGTDEVNGFDGFFKGSFTKTIVPADGLFLNDNKFWYSTGKTEIKAFRGWIELPEVLDKDTDFGVKLNIIVDGEETKIDGINSENTNDAVYTLDGKYVGKDMNRLRKGIYIQNGKKVVK